MTNKYSEAFKQKVKQVYPDSKEMHQMANDNVYFLGRYLDDSSSSAIPARMVIDATSLEVLKEYAKKELAKVDLYREWHNETATWI